MDASNFVRMVERTSYDVTTTPCNHYVEIYSGRDDNGRSANPGDTFKCGWCGKVHTIASVTPPLVK